MADVIKGTCQTVGCGKAATLQCPKCKELNLPPSFFCSQACFKTFWPIHKIMHDPSYSYTPPDKFKNYKFTGAVRPGIISPKRAVPAHIKRPDYAETGVPVSEEKLRGSHTVEAIDAAGIAAMREVSRIGREILDIAGASIKAGITTDEIDRIVHEATIARNAYPVLFSSSI